MKITTAQHICTSWAKSCLGVACVNSKIERAKRLLEEAIEFAQCAGVNCGDCHKLLAQVYDKPVGEPAQEIAGILVTTLVAAETFGINAEAALRQELERINRPEIIIEIRAKHRQKKELGISDI